MVANKLSLEEILNKIFIVKDYSYFNELLDENNKKLNDIHRIVGFNISRYWNDSTNGFVISRDYIKGIIYSVLMEISWRWFDVNKCSKGNLVNAYLAFIDANLSGKVYQEIYKEREDNYKRKTKKRKKKFNNNLKVELYGSIDDLSQMEYENIQFNKLISVYGRDFEINEKEEKENDRFELLINDCTYRQKEVLRLLFIEKYSEYDISQKLNISRDSVHGLKERSINKLKLADHHQN